jgi:hypothetical protein
MPKFLIEVAHEEETVACARVVDVFLKSGSHFLSNADWGCRDKQHKAWLIVDVANKDEALRIVPPAFRDKAKVTGLNTFRMEEIQDILDRHRT